MSSTARRVRKIHMRRISAADLLIRVISFGCCWSESLLSRSQHSACSQSAATLFEHFVQITGKCVQYFGRNGEIHTEWFPGVKGK